VTTYQKEIADVALEQIAYVDKTGIDTYLYREYGYAPRGQKIISPMEYFGAMDSGLFEF
jgi:hypothetical protein